MAAIPDWKDSLRESASLNAFPVQTVLVPLEAGEFSRLVLAVAQTLAQLLDATLHLLPIGEVQRDARATFEQLGMAGEQMRGAVLDQVVGDPADAIMSVARRVAAFWQNTFSNRQSSFSCQQTVSVYRHSTPEVDREVTK